MVLKLRKCMSILDTSFLEMGGITSGTYSLREGSFTRKTQNRQVLEKVYLYCGFLGLAPVTKGVLAGPQTRVQPPLGC